MRPESNSSLDLSHEACSELLPWFVNRTLDPAERRAAAAHLDRCAACRAEVTLLQEVAGAVNEERDEPRIHGDLEAVHGRIEAGSVLPFRLAPTVRWVLAGQAAAILALLAVLLWPAPGPPQAYRTLADRPAAGTGDGVLIRVVFRDDARAAEIRRLLLSIRGELTAGPNTAGAYELRIDGGAASRGPDAVLERLRADPLIRLAEPISAAAP